MEFIRKRYLDELLKWKDKHSIKILTGVRRCGKSTILRQFKKLLLKDKSINKSQIISFNFSEESLSTMTYHELHEAIMKASNKKHMNYVFLDEVQEVDNFEKAIISLFENEDYKFDIYITGSNSKMFSEELASLFTNRYIRIKCYPFSFKEYLEFADSTGDLQKRGRYEVFEDFLKYGSLPTIFEVWDDKKMVKTRLQSLINDSIRHDIKGRHRLIRPEEFYQVVEYSFENIGHDFSNRKTSNFLRSNNKTTTSYPAVRRYMEWLCEAVLFTKVRFFNTKGKKILITAGKYYCVDQGLRNSYSDFEIVNRGSLLENIVLNELMIRGYDVYIGKTRSGEIDFVTKKDSQYMYIQVASKLDKESTKKREYDRLLEINDYFKRLVITEEQVHFTDKSGIETINIVEWLTKE